MKIEDVLNKTCLIGLSYINTNGDLLKQAQYEVPLSQRIRKKALLLSSTPLKVQRKVRSPRRRNFTFMLHQMFGLQRLKATHKNVEYHINLENPDYFVTWNAVKKEDDTEEGQQEWWEWHPQSQAPRVN